MRVESRTISRPTVCVLGGTGFVGEHLVNRLADEGYRVRVITRHRERHRALLVRPEVELIDRQYSCCRSSTPAFRRLCGGNQSRCYPERTSTR